MDTYTRRWRTATALATAPFAIAAVLWQPLTAGLLLVMVTVITAVFGAATSSTPLLSCLRNGLLTGVGVLAVIGAIVMVGGWVLPLGCLIAVTSPPCVRQILSWAQAAGLGRDPEATGLPGEHAPELVRTLSTADLCQAWSDSNAAIDHATTAGTRARLAGIRQLYLDEFERRDAQGCRAWLARGPAAGSNPAPFLRQDD